MLKDQGKRKACKNAKTPVFHGLLDVCRSVVRDDLAPREVLVGAAAPGFSSCLLRQATRIRTMQRRPNFDASN